MTAAPNAWSNDLAGAVVLDGGAADQEEVADGLACLGTGEVTTVRGSEIDD
jgi:hypothetical protein